MESLVYAVVSLWISSPQIYRLLISASPTMMETQVQSSELSAIYALSFHYKNYTYTTTGVKFKSNQLFIHLFLKLRATSRTSLANHFKSKRVKALNFKNTQCENSLFAA